MEHVRDLWALFGGFSVGDQLSRRYRRRAVFLERWN